ncbi:MAG: cysteine synthase [Bacteroidetes bacterium HGW-Bacteroidetes-1]|jgi:cysteine synthase A|nr:MAG: cysteine synthase [Bacteroidetes bacterium HGW-Bacteroidetes-1]
MKESTLRTNSAAKFKTIWRLVGNSPLLSIRFRYKGEERVAYAKSEQYNITGSIKDRMALYILQKSYETGAIKPGDTIVEATSGNTGISFSAIGRMLGHPVQILMPDWLSRERVDIIRSLGAEIIPVTRDQGGFLGSIRISEEIAATKANIYLPKQFANQYNIETHVQTTGRELWNQMHNHGLLPAAFVAGIGTGGTAMGVGRYLRTKNPDVKIYPLEPANSPTMSTGYKVGHHRIQGISDEFIPEIVKLNELDEIIAVDDGDSIIMAQKLAGELGLAVGISSGANFLGVIEAQNRLGSNAVVATVFPDSNKKYLSTDLLRCEPVKEDFFSTDVELIDYQVFKRVCEICCDGDECTQMFENCFYQKKNNNSIKSSKRK